MPKSLSHVVVLTEDLDAVLRFLSEVGGVPGVTHYDPDPANISTLFGWPVEHASTRGAFVGEGPGAIDVLEIPAPLRGSVAAGVRLLAIVNRDVTAAGEAAAAAGFGVRGPFEATAATGAAMALIEVTAGGIPFELVSFG